MREKMIELLYDAMFFEGYGRELCEQQADHLIANGVTIAKDNNVPSKWIPVTERLPESKVKILVYGGSIEIWHNGVKQPMPSIFTGYMRGLDEGWFAWESDDYISNVTHWMPLPEPPKGE